ncbi:ArnT family glycosyltransferase [Candidatus Margulisiibacteriota bacterium]
MQLIFALLTPFLLGFGFLRFFMSAWILFALAYPVGIGILGLIIFFLGILKIPLTLINIASLAWLMIILLFSLSYKKKLFPLTFPLPAIKSFSPVEWLLFFGITFKVIFVFFEALIKPVFTWDAWSRYALVAKIIYYKQGFMGNFALQRMEDYPPLIMFNQAWIFICDGAWNDTIIKIISPLFFLALLAIFYYGLSKSLDRSKALGLTFLLSSLPLLVFHSTTAYLDLPATFYFSAGFIFLFMFLRENKNSDLIISACLLGLGIWTKRAGIYLAMVSILIYLVNFKQLKKTEIIKFICIIFLLALPWLIYSRIIPIQHYWSVAQVAAETKVDLQNRAPLVIKVFIAKMFFSANWHLSWALLVYAMLFYRERIFSNYKWTFALAISICLILFLCIFMFTDGFKYIIDGTLLNRVMLYIMPLVLFYSGLIIFEDRP